MKNLTPDEIFAAQDVASELVPVPEWGPEAAVRVRAFDLAARDAYYRPASLLHADATLSDDERRDKLSAFASSASARLVVFTVVNDDGSLKFTEAHIPALQAKSSRAIDRICAVARRLNGLEGTAVEDAAKNSSASPT